MNTQTKYFAPLLHNGNGSVMANFMMCHYEAFQELGLPVKVVSIGDSHAGRGMNKTACDFLASDCDVWLNIDADVLFTAKDLKRLAERDVPLLYGIYPKKQDDTPPCLGTFEDGPREREDGLVECRRAGRGFMRVTRALLESMKEENGGHAKKFYNHGRDEWEFFESGVVTGEMSALENGAPEWISEDWYFCERARQLGVPTLVDPSIALMHEGSKIYRFGNSQLNRVDGWRSIQGWFSEADAECYKRIASELPTNGEFAEVGTWMGRSLACMIDHCRALGKSPTLHAIDTFRGTDADGHGEIVAAHGGSIRPAFEANMERIGASIEIHEGESVVESFVFEDGSLDAAFIDGDHSYHATLDDIQAYLPKVKSGGILAGHDADYPDVKRALNDAGVKYETVGRCWMHRKP